MEGEVEDWYECSSAELFRAAENITMMIGLKKGRRQEVPNLPKGNKELGIH